MKVMKMHCQSMKREMNPELVNVCYESHLRNNLFKYKKRPHPNSWVYHPDVNMHTYMGRSDIVDPSLPFERTAARVLSSNFTMPLDENTANASIHRVPVEVSTVDEAFDTDAFRKACQASPNLAGVYFAIDCQKCDLSGVDTSGRRCRVLLSEHVSDIRLADIDPRKIHPQIMLNLVAQVLHAVYVMHSHGFIHGAINADNIFVNYVDYLALADDADSSESILLFGHGTPANAAEDMCGNYEFVYAMHNAERCGVRRQPAAQPEDHTTGGVQLVLGGYNGVRKINSSFCRTSDDVASVILTFAQKFGSNFLYFFSTNGPVLLRDQRWTGAPLLPLLANKGHAKLIDDHISLVARNLPGKENNEEVIERNIRRYPWLKMFTCASEALSALCGPSFRPIARYDANGGRIRIDGAAVRQGAADPLAGALANADVPEIKNVALKNKNYSRLDAGNTNITNYVRTNGVALRPEFTNLNPDQRIAPLKSAVLAMGDTTTDAQWDAFRGAPDAHARALGHKVRAFLNHRFGTAEELQSRNQNQQHHLHYPDVANLMD